VALLILLLAALPAAAYDLVRARALLSGYCYKCHQATQPAAGLNLRALGAINERAPVWAKTAARVKDGSMPPKGHPGPSLDEREAFSAWVTETVRAAACADGIQPPPRRLERLNRAEYAATVRDLLNIHINAGYSLPADGSGGEGFDNAAETLFLSPMHGEKYLESAKTALDYARRDPRSRAVFLTSKTDARAILAGFLPRAFRRPAADAEIGKYLALFDDARKRGGTFDESILYALRAVLVSPHFLFRLETGHWAIASRLSYFLWGSMPDKDLSTLAAVGQLRNPAVLRCEMTRMVKDVKVTEFAERFVEQWLGTRELGRAIKPDAALFAPYYDAEIQSGIKYEPVIFFQEMLARNKPVTDLIDSNWTVLTNKLERFYGLPQTKGIRQQPVAVDLPEGSHRGGVLGMAAVLAVSSYPTRTSPVLRGKWVLESLLGTPPPPPPPSVPELEESKAAAPKTLRERLESHRANPACAGCHQRMDPIGFGLENYDVLGRWRTADEGKPIDARGELPTGETFDGPEGLKKLLLGRKDQFTRQLATKLLGYALGRGLTPEDHCAIDKIVAETVKNGYRSQTLIEQIILSEPFLDTTEPKLK
jgi:hypothetical protein